MLYSHTLSFFFFNDTATTEIYTLSLHDALPISGRPGPGRCSPIFHSICGSKDVTTASISVSAPNANRPGCTITCARLVIVTDRKSTRLNSSHSQISYAVFCLKKKNTHERADRASPPNTPLSNSLLCSAPSP